MIRVRKRFDELDDGPTSAPSSGNIPVWSGTRWQPGTPALTDKNYVHTQGSPSATWVIVHNLGKYPSVTVIDSAGQPATGDVIYDSLNQVTVAFRASFSGSASLN